MTSRLPRRSILRTAAVCVAPAPLCAANQRFFRLICPFPAGGTVDSIARSLTDGLTAELDRPVMVDIRTGGNGAVAMQQLMASPPDGDTWMLATLGSTLFLMTGPAGVDPVSALQGLALIAYDISVLVVPSSLSATNPSDLQRLAQRRPTALNYLRTGEASLSHLVMGCLARQMTLDLQAIDYRGQPPGIVDLIAGRLDLGVLNLGMVMPYIRNGTLRPLAVVGTRRAAELPDVPTLNELGLPDASVTSWAMAVVRTGTPALVVERLRRAFGRVLAQPDVRARLVAAGVVPTEHDDTGDADQTLRRAISRNERLLSAIGLRPDQGEAADPASQTCAPERGFGASRTAPLADDRR